MKVFETIFDANIHVLEYCTGLDFQYKEIEQIDAESNRIDLSILVDFKYMDRPQSGTLELDIVLIKDICEDEVPRTQTVERLTIWEASTETLHDTALKAQASIDQVTLINDPWKYRYSHKFDFKNIPVAGAGSYAIALFASKQDLEKDKRPLLDCAYIKVN